MEKWIVMPSSRNKTYVQFFYSGHDAPFICGADGHVTSDMMDEVESEYLEGFELCGSDVFKEAGDYLFQVNRESAQTGEFGRIEIPEYWNVCFVRFEPLSA